jgi:hypothetical protein
MKGLSTFIAFLLEDKWKVLLYALLILLCVIFAPEEPLKFIYTEF